MDLIGYVILAKGSKCKYNSTRWASMYIYGDYDSLGSWDCGYNERFWLAIL